MKARDFYFSRIVSALFFLSLPLLAISQETTSCAENLQNAQSLFDRGQVEKVVGMLRSCMKSGFTREEQLSAYKLVIQSYLLGDKLREADSAMLAFLKQNPEYQLSPTDHASFVHIYNSFNVKPVLQLALHIGTNLPFMTFVDPKSVSGEVIAGEYSTKALNLFVSLEAKYQIKPRLEVNIEGGYSQLSFTNIEKFNDFAEINYNETQYRIEVPLTVTYNVVTLGEKLTVYARGGAGTAFTLASNANKVSFDETGLTNFKDKTVSDISREDSRIKMDLFGQAGGGLKFKIPKGYLNFEIRSNFGVYNQVLRGGDSAANLEGGYNHKDDDFNLNDLNFSLGYTLILYKPAKRE
jgi:hypothetical protein